MNNTAIEVTNKIAGTNMPYVGMHATLSIGTDLKPFEIIKVNTPRKIVIRSLDARRIDNNGYYSENQEHEFTSNPDGIEYVVSLRKDNIWRVQGSTYLTVKLGKARMYHDPHF